MPTDPISLDAALASFDQLWSPRIVTRVNDYDVRVAKVRGEFPWHAHADTDEFFLVLDGELDIALRDGASGGAGPAEDDGGVRTVTLARGAVYVVPRGVEHRPSSAAGASILLFEPTGTVNVGDRAGTEVPGHVDVTAGHPL